MNDQMQALPPKMPDRVSNAHEGYIEIANKLECQIQKDNVNCKGVRKGSICPIRSMV